MLMLMAQQRSALRVWELTRHTAHWPYAASTYLLRRGGMAQCICGNKSRMPCKGQPCAGGHCRQQLSQQQTNNVMTTHYYTYRGCPGPWLVYSVRRAYEYLQWADLSWLSNTSCTAVGSGGQPAKKAPRLPLLFIHETIRSPASRSIVHAP